MQQYRKIDQFRCWVLMLLYAAMVLFGVLLTFTTISLWSLLESQQIAAGILIATSLTTTATSLRSLRIFLHVLRVEKGIPKLELAPFFFMLVSTLIASRLFSNM